MMQMFQLWLETLRLVEQVDGDVEASQHTHGVRDELGWAGVITSNIVEQRTRLRNLCEHPATSEAAAAL